MTPKPRLLMVARTRYALPLSPSLERKFAALRERFELRVLAASGDGRPRDDGVFVLMRRFPVLDGPLFWLLLPVRVRQAVRRHRANAILVQSPYEAALALLGAPRTAVVVELHGDWRSATRLYGSPLRRLLAPIADVVAERALRRAQAIRTISQYTSGLVRAVGREPDAEFPAFMDLELFLDRPPAPLPDEPRALFIGVLELYKNIDGLARAWRSVVERTPDASLVIVGDGTRHAAVEELARDLPEQVTWLRRLEQPEVARAMDDATCLVLPSRSEGLGRVIVEAFCRGRPVVASRIGGIPDLVDDDVSGLLVDSDAELADALVRLLDDRQLAERLAAGAQDAAQGWIASPAEYADRVAELVAPYTGRP